MEWKENERERASRAHSYICIPITWPLTLFLPSKLPLFTPLCIPCPSAVEHIKKQPCGYCIKLIGYVWRDFAGLRTAGGIPP